jgi:hypothetical protein
MPYGRRLQCLGLCLAIAALAACGPNVLSTRGKVLHPLHEFAEGDTEAPRPPRILVIYRKENRVVVRHMIVGAQGRPRALELLGEFAYIPEQYGVGDGLYVEVMIFSNYRDELKDMGDYEYWLELPDGRRVKGAVHVQHGRKDFTIKVTGAHRAPHLTTMNKTTGEVRVYSHIEEVENEYELYSRWARIIFVDPSLITRETPYITFVVRGYDRERRYRFDFTWKPEEAIMESNKHER